MNKVNGLGRAASQEAGLASGSVVRHDFRGSGVRSVARDRETWFVAADVCAAIGHTDPSKAVSRLEDDEKATTIVRTPGGPQEMVVVNESGLYALVLKSRKPEARAFRRWITGEVIPSIRRTGAYTVEGSCAPGLLPNFNEPGRYVTMVAPGRAPHIQRYRLETLLDDVCENDCMLMALALKTVETWWHKTEQLAAIGLETRETFGAAGLERAIRDGAQLADQVLRSQHREETRD